jgi:hypothetical protein
MTKYTLIAEHKDLFTGKTLTKNSTEFEVDGLMDVLENVEMFLKGTGFIFDGYLDIVPPEENTIQDDIGVHEFEFSTMQDTPITGYQSTVTVNRGDDTITLSDMENHSKFYFDTERNK